MGDWVKYTMVFSYNGMSYRLNKDMIARISKIQCSIKKNIARGRTSVIAKAKAVLGGSLQTEAHIRPLPHLPTFPEASRLACLKESVFSCFTLRPEDLQQARHGQFAYSSLTVQNKGKLALS